MVRALSLVTPALVLGLAAGAAAGDDAPFVGFDDGAQGWSINGLDAITPTGGNPAEHIRWPNPVDTFGISARNETNTAFLGDYTAKGEVTLSIDVKVEFIEFFGTPVSRDFVVVLFDDDEFEGAPPAQVWAHLGTLDGNGMPWTTFSAAVTDVFSATLPAGWNGAGDEDPKTFEPILPAGRSWTDVLAGVDRIEFTTFVPGFFFGFTNFDIRVDNVSVGAEAWSDQGSALAGVLGDPLLAGSGTALPLSQNTIELSNAATNALTGLFAGIAADPLPFKGGVLVPMPQISVFTNSGPAGGFAIEFRMPDGVPSATEIWIQAAIQDAAAIHGVALSNAIRGLVP